MPALPPLAIPDAILQASKPAGVDPAVAHAAGWAAQFGNGDTNFAQRQNHEQDLQAYAEQLLASRQAIEQQHLERSAGARALLQQQQSMDFAKELQPLKVEAEQSLIAARAASERAAVARQKAQADMVIHNAAKEQAQHEDTSGLISHLAELRSRGITEKSPEWVDGVRVGMNTFQDANPALQREVAATILKGQDVNAMTPEEISAKVAAMKTAQPNQEFRMNAKGDVTVNTIQGRPGPTEITPDKRLQHLESLRMKPNVDEDVKKYLDEEITKLKTPAVSPVAPAPPDLTDLAKRALADPNATEAHKARAKVILGL